MSVLPAKFFVPRQAASHRVIFESVLLGTKMSNLLVWRPASAVDKQRRLPGSMPERNTSSAERRRCFVSHHSFSWKEHAALVRALLFVSCSKIGAAAAVSFQSLATVVHCGKCADRKRDSVGVAQGHSNKYSGSCARLPDHRPTAEAKKPRGHTRTHMRRFINAATFRIFELRTVLCKP